MPGLVKSYHKILLWMGILFLTVHFILVLIYVNPFKADTGKARFYAGVYAYPFFQQRWDLFVPPVDCNYMLFARDIEEAGDIFGEIKRKQRASPFCGYEQVMQVFSNSIHVFEKSSPLQAKVNGPVKDDINFTIVKHAAVNYLRSRDIKAPGDMRLILLVDDVRTGKKRIYFN